MLEEGRARQRERERSRGGPRPSGRPPRSRHDSGEASRWRWPAAMLAVALVGSSTAVLAAGAIGRGPLKDIGWQELTMQPEEFRFAGQRTQARMIDVGFALASDESCGGSFTVEVSETAQAVVVGAVVHRVPRVTVIEPECTVPVPADGRVFAKVDLNTPLGQRQVIRQQDQRVLPGG